MAKTAITVNVDATHSYTVPGSKYLQGQAYAATASAGVLTINSTVTIASFFSNSTNSRQVQANAGDVFTTLSGPLTITGWLFDA